VLGVARSRIQQDSRRDLVLTGPLEHPAVAEPAGMLAAQGFEVRSLPIDQNGVLDPEAASQLIRSERNRIAVASLQWVNQETGISQPIEGLAAICAEASVPLHTDAVQALGHLPIGFLPGISALSVSGHKVGAPVGIGALLARRDLGIAPVAGGGGQERKIRSGTIPGALIASFAAAVREAVAGQAELFSHLSALRSQLVSGLNVMGAQIVGGPAASPQTERPFELPTTSLRGGGAAADAAIQKASVDAQARQSPHICYALFDGCSAEILLMLLDQAGFSVSTGSACTAGVAEPSPVLLALGYSEQQARTGVRFSMGWTTTKDDVDRLLGVLPEAISRARLATGTERTRP
jgi:cysteine desulfurase